MKRYTRRFNSHLIPFTFLVLTLVNLVNVFGHLNYSYEEEIKLFVANHPYTGRKITPKEIKAIPKPFRPDLALEQDFFMTLDPKLKRVPFERRDATLQYTQKLLRQKALQRGISGVEWDERGPNNVGGRSRAVMFDPNDPTGNKVWAGSVTGGLWYNEDIGTINSWQSVNDFWVNIAITAIAYDPTDTRTFYVGTGEAFGSFAVRGNGIWKTTDGGVNWSQLSSTSNNSNFYWVQDLEVTPTGTVIVGTVTGTFRSTNGGSSWSRVQDSNNFNIGNTTDIEVASNGDIYIGVNANRIYKSSAANDGASGTWIPVSHGGLGGSRVELAVAPSNDNVVYAIASDGSNIAWFRKSTNGGVSWSALTIPQYYSQSCVPDGEDFTRGQSWYNLILGVHPSDENFVLAGGIDVHRSVDGGANWEMISYWTGRCDMYMHADQHAIEFNPANVDEVMFGNDGGIAWSANVRATDPVISHRNQDYNVTQYYAVATENESGSNYFLAGSQDNGTQQYQNDGINSTRQATGGDGGYCHIDQDNSDIQLTSFVFNTIFVSSNGGSSFSTLYRDPANQGRFINPSDYDDQENILYTAGEDNEMVRYSGIGGSGIRKDLILNLRGGQISHIRVSPYTPNTVFVGTGFPEGDIFRIDNAHTDTPTVTHINSAIGGNLAVTSIDVGVNDDQLLITFGNYGVNNVYETTNGGGNWTSKEGNLPDMPIRWCLYNPGNRDEALLATNFGVWSTTDLNTSSPTWDPTNVGLANVRCDMLQYRESDGLVVVATHGRGIFTSYPFTDGCKSPVNLAASNLSSDSFTLSWDAIDGAVSYDVDVDGTISNVTGTSFDVIGLTEATRYTCQVRANCASGSSGYSSSINVTTSVSCEVPTGLQASNITASSFSLSWGAITGATSYDVSINGTVVNVSATNYNATGLSPNTVYTCQVRANCGSGSSLFTSELDVRTEILPTCEVPSGLSSSNLSTDSFTLSWDAVTGATSYDVNIDGTVTNVVTTSYGVTGLDENTTYTCQVRARCAGGNSAYSPGLPVTTLASSPSCEVPSGLTSPAIATTSFSLVWDVVTGATSYDVEVDGTIVNVGTPTHDLTGLSPNTTYTCRVRAVCPSGNSNFSAPVDVTTAAIAAGCESPNGLTPSGITSDGFVLNWEAVADANSYRLRINGETTDVSVTNHSISGLTPNTTYMCEVMASCSSGDSEFSDVVEVTTSSVVAGCGVPLRLQSLNITANSFELRWDAVDGALSYNVSVGDEIVNVGLVNTYEASNLSINTTYLCKVQAVCSSGEGAYSNEISVTTLDTFLECSEPTNFDVRKVGANSFELVWEAVDGAISYDISVNDLVTNTTATSFVVDGLKPNTDHRCRVLARCDVGSSEYTREIVVTTTDNVENLKIPKLFSPNNDTKNDVWEFENVELIQNCTVIVYDQFGAKVFEAMPYNNDWGGTSGGRDLLEGAYYYIIKCEEELLRSGGVRLIR